MWQRIYQALRTIIMLSLYSVTAVTLGRLFLALKHLKRSLADLGIGKESAI